MNEKKETFDIGELGLNGVVGGVSGTIAGTFAIAGSALSVGASRLASLAI